MTHDEAARPAKLVEAGDYNGESAIVVAATQLGSAHSTRRKGQVVDEWVDLFNSGPTAVQSLQFTTRTPKPLFAALANQSQLDSLCVKWGDYDDLTVLSGMEKLRVLRLRGASKVKDLAPLAHLRQVVVLAIEGLADLIDAEPIGEMSSVRGSPSLGREA